MWHFNRNEVPKDIAKGTPNPSGWGTPVTNLASTHCDLNSFFGPQSLIINGASFVIIQMRFSPNMRISSSRTVRYMGWCSLPWRSQSLRQFCSVEPRCIRECVFRNCVRQVLSVILSSIAFMSRKRVLSAIISSFFLYIILSPPSCIFYGAIWLRSTEIYNHFGVIGICMGLFID